MLALTDPTLDLLVPQLFLQRLLLRLAAAGLGLLGLHILPIPRRSEQDILAHGRGIGLGSLGLSLLKAELRPLSTLGDYGVDLLLDDCGAGFARNFDFLALVVEAV
jgi:hypothetical protein